MIPDFIKQRVPLGPMTTLGVGGEARFYAEVTDDAGLKSAMEWAVEAELDVHLLGEGSNIVVADAGFAGLVIRQRADQIHFENAGADVRVTAAAGAGWDALVSRCTQESLAGIECLAGIPGLVGAAPIQNIGAYGQELASVVESVRCLDRQGLGFVDFGRDACGFDYRMSRFKADPSQRYIVTEIALRLTPGGAPTIRYGELAKTIKAGADLEEVRAAVLGIRRGKSMVVDPRDPNSRSAGSFFMNPRVDADTLERVRIGIANLGMTEDQMPCWSLPDGRTKLAAAWLIEKSGLVRGYGVGPVGLSEKHTLAIVNRGGATAADVVNFARLVRTRVLEAFGVTLIPEPGFIGFDVPVCDLLA